MQIREIKDLKTRNFLRGLVANTNSYERGSKYVEQVTVTHAVRDCPSEDLETLVMMLIKHKHDEVYFGDKFPTIAPKLFLKPHGLMRKERADTVISTYIAVYREKSLHVLAALKEINKAILDLDFENAVSRCETMHEKYGASRTLLRKLAYIYSRSLRAGEVREEFKSERLKPLIAKVFYKRSQALVTYFNSYIDFSDPGMEVTKHLSKNLGTIEKELQNERADTDGLVRQIEVLFPTLDIELDRYSSASEVAYSAFVDMVAYASSRSATHPSGPYGRGTGFWRSLGLDNALNILDPADSDIRRTCKESEEESAEQHLYKLSSALSEVPKLANFRNSLDSTVASRSPILCACAKVRTETEFFKKNTTLKNLCVTPKNKELSILQYDNNKADVLTRTFAVLHCLEAGEVLSGLAPEKLRQLLNQTSGFSSLLTTDELKTLLESARESETETVEFLALVMLHNRLGDEDTSFDLRDALERVLKTKFNNSFEDFLASLKQRTPAICIAVCEVLTIPFLEKLYRIMRTYTDALKTRENICRWMGKKFKDDFYTTQAERLSLDIKIREIRGEIDDARIYVDELKYKQWLTDNVAPLLRKHERALAGSLQNGVIVSQLPTAMDANALAELRAMISGPDYYWLDEAANQAYETFCTDKVFGINSYLGRRIRHGTIVGFLLAPINKIFSGSHFREATKSQTIKNEFERWLETYRELVHYLRDEYLKIRSNETPNGAFNLDTLSSTDRINIRLDYRGKVDSLFKRRVPYQDVASTLYEYCWSVVQTDLLVIQKEIAKKYRLIVRTRLREIGEKHQGNALVKQLVNELDTNTDALFSEFTGWFSKPETASISTSIREICEAAVQEAKSYKPTFVAPISYDGDVESKMYGLLYQHIYDIMKVFVENVSEHGSLEKPIKIWSAFAPRGGQGAIHISIRSGLKNDAISKNVEQSINDAVSGDVVNEALARDKKSGLCKVIAVIIGQGGRREDLTWNWVGSDIEFRVSLPMILFTSEADQ